MQENTNKAIVINSIINYAKMGINTVLALLTTRFALQVLGVVDYGLFSLLGGIISFIGIFNTVMLSTCNRFISVAVGRGDTQEINKQFNINIVIFVGLALLMLLISYPVGDWYIHKYVNYDGPIRNAMMVFVISILGSVISTIAIPFNGLLMAKERFAVFGLMEVLDHVIRFIAVLYLSNHIENKLLFYTIIMAVTTALPLPAYWLYCRHNFYEYIKLYIPKDRQAFKELFSFSGWVAYGAVACIARNQGAALIVNNFFNTVANTALGLANSLIAYIQMFANNLTQPIQPQITKSYVTGNIERTDELLVMSTKFSYLLMLLVSTPFFVGGNWILSLWLGEVPPYLLSFTILLIIDNLVASFNSGLSVLLFASGKIALYQVIINTLRLLSILAGYFVLKAGTPPEMLFVTYIAFSILIVLCTQWCLHKSMHYSTRTLIVKSYVPSIIITLLFLPIIFLHLKIHPILYICSAIFYLLILIFFIGLSKKERNVLFSFLTAKIKK